MILEQRIYSILIVNANKNFADSILPLISNARYYPIDKAGSINEARRKIADRFYDIVLINTPLPDDFGFRFAIDVISSTGSVVLLFVRSDSYDAVYEKAHSNGIFLLKKPTSINAIEQSLDWLCIMRERMYKMETKLVSLQEKMNEIKLVNRAKWVLITNLNMTEEDAHHYIEKQAMDSCVSKRVIAEEILRIYKD